MNVSGAQLAGPEFVTDVIEALEVSGLPPHRLILEIAETAVVGDIETSIEQLERLRHLGLRVAIDDFGAGYSSLAYVRRLPVDILKIDESFVDGVATNRTDREVATTILSLADNLGLTSVAEGIEHPEQAAVLRDLGCDTGQGFLWARPRLPADLQP